MTESRWEVRLMRLSNTALSLCLLAAIALPGFAQKKPVPAAKPAEPAVPTRVEFLRDVAPILDRSGCSTAGCHGKFGGRGGLQISLLTLSPEDDYEPLVYGGRGRRINFVAPEKSLLLLKATMGVAHAGGPRFAVGSQQYNTILKWIKAGAPFDDKDPRLVSLSISPEKVTLEKAHKPSPTMQSEPRQLTVTAIYTDGSQRNVTNQTSFQSTNDGVLEVSQNGVVKGKRWGGGAILGRYLGTIVSSSITLPQDRKGAYPVIPASNVIDKFTLDNFKRLNVIQIGRAHV